jgi:hypothetical protein
MNRLLCSLKNTKDLGFYSRFTCIYTLFFLFFLMACSKKTSPSQPAAAVTDEREYFDFDQERAQPMSDTSRILPPVSAIQSISELQLPVEIDTSVLTQQINKLMPNTLYEDRDFSDDKMIVVAEKIDSVSISVTPDYIAYQVPFKLHIERDINISIVKADGALKLFFKTDYKLHENWALETHTTILHHEWLEKPKVKLGIIQIPIEAIANRIMQRSADMVCKNIDAQLMENVKLREYVDQAWRKIQEPQLITDTPVVSWLMIRPEKIMMEPIRTAKDKIQTSLIFRSSTDLAFGPKPELPYAGILPVFESIPAKNADSLITISLRFPLKRAEVLVSEYFKGREYKDGNKTMILDSITLEGKGDDLRVIAFISGTYKAALELNGKPVYNKSKRKFELKNLAYSLKSRNLLIKAASWILHKNMEKRLADLMVYEIGPYLDQSRTNLTQSLATISSFGFKMKPEIDDIWALDPILHQEEAEIKIVCKGRFRIIVDENTP